MPHICRRLHPSRHCLCGWPGSPLLSESRQSPLVCHETHLIVSRRFRLRRRQRYSSHHLWFHRTRQSCTALLPAKYIAASNVTKEISLVHNPERSNQKASSMWSTFLPTINSPTYSRNHSRPIATMSPPRSHRYGFLCHHLIHTIFSFLLSTLIS